MKRIGLRQTSTRPQSKYVMSLLAASVSSIAGFLMCLPSLWYAIFGASHAQLSLLEILAILLLIIGLPMFLFGLIGFMARRGAPTSTLESDVSRIRFAAETHMMNDVMKGLRKDDK